MSRAVMLSVRPKWVEMIASGKKTIEVRKTRPKLETPFKCYIYETKGEIERPRGDEDGYIYQEGHGAVIGEFVCDAIYKFSTVVYLGEEQLLPDSEIVEKSCVPRPDLRNYEGTKGPYGLYGWHISDLKIYDTPKTLTEFIGLTKTRFGYAERALRHPPQSYYFVEELL